ncbi:Os06g0193700 [Oryza sativa Japonica Group]|uniref:Os06g0193700 protein n=1 Tax=Oryza sativa subsp. japonica TaxID=39947 RepID=A0A0P0WU15_ORYSJ|nr:Os06g0193700 [Oryza sativa Japonica Group]
MAGEAEDGDGERLRLFVSQVPCSMAEEEILAVDRAALVPTTPPSSATKLPCSRFEGASGSPDDNLDRPATAAEPRGGHGVVHGDGQRRPVGRKAAGPRRTGRRHRC